MNVCLLYYMDNIYTMFMTRYIKSPLNACLAPFIKGGDIFSGVVMSVVILAAISLSIDPAHAARLYKWVDENGQVHFSDKIPPQQIKREHQEINEQGIETKTVEAAKTPEEIAEERRQRALKAEQDRLAKEQAEKDRILLDTFSNEEQIISARDRQLAAMEADNQITKGSIESLTVKLQEQTRNAANYERQGKAVPEDILKEIDHIKMVIEQNRASIRAKQQEELKLKEKYQGYLDRFRELKNR